MKSEKLKIKNSFASLRFYVAAGLIFAFVFSGIAQKNAKKPPVKSMNSSIATVFQPGKSPTVSLRIQFLTGSIDDPEGKEGLAALTAAMLSQGGTRSLTYD